MQFTTFGKNSAKRTYKTKDKAMTTLIDYEGVSLTLAEVRYKALQLELDDAYNRVCVPSSYGLLSIAEALFLKIIIEEEATAF